MNDFNELLNLFQTIHNKTELRLLIKDLFTHSEIKILVERWKTVSLLLDGFSHREVQKQVGISISKVTHAANFLKKEGKGFRIVYHRLKKGSSHVLPHGKM